MNPESKPPFRAGSIGIGILPIFACIGIGLVFKVSVF